MGVMFVGHLLPGAFICLIAIWWLLRYGAFLWQRDGNGAKYVSQQARQMSFYYLSQVTKPTETGLPIISAIIFALPFLLTGRELFVTGGYIYMDTAQHMTMYFSFALMSLGGILTWISLRVKFLSMIPQECMHLTSAIPIFVIGLLFSFHLDGRPPLDVRVHTIFYTWAFVCVFLHLAEMWNPRSAKLVFLRIYAYIQLGSWLIAIGYVLENWNSDSEAAASASIMFAVFLMMNFVLLIAGVVGAYYLGRWTCMLDPRGWTIPEENLKDDFGLLGEQSIDNEAL